MLYIDLQARKNLEQCLYATRQNKVTYIWCELLQWPYVTIHSTIHRTSRRLGDDHNEGIAGLDVYSSDRHYTNCKTTFGRILVSYKCAHPRDTDNHNGGNACLDDDSLG